MEVSRGAGRILEDSGEGGADGGLLGDRKAADDGGVAAGEIQGVLVEDGSHCFVELGQFLAELYGAFKEDLYGNSPKFVVISGGVVAEEIFCADLLHRGKDGAGDF